MAEQTKSVDKGVISDKKKPSTVWSIGCNNVCGIINYYVIATFVEEIESTPKF